MVAYVRHPLFDMQNGMEYCTYISLSMDVTLMCLSLFHFVSSHVAYHDLVIEICKILIALCPYPQASLQISIRNEASEEFV